MKNGKKLPSFIAGMVTMALVCMLCVPALAANNTQTLQNVRMGGIRIVVDGQEIHPTDANGKEVSPMIYNGTTYLPVRAVASALDKAVYWDGPSYTVYLGKMNGTLEYPTVMLKDLTNISGYAANETDKLVDNYGNTYTTAIDNVKGLGTSGTPFAEYLTNMQYSRLKGTIYVPEGSISDETVFVTVEADDKVIYTSPQMTKTSKPVDIDVNITGYNDIAIVFSHKSTFYLGTGGEFVVCFGNGGFYQ